jgi:hypothetical protein
MARPAPAKVMTSLLPGVMAVAALCGISFVAGVTEHPMTPFRSPIYVLAVLVTFFISVQRGAIEAMFLSTGFITLLLLGSAFRSEESLLAFGEELPLDMFLFYSIAILPGFIVSLYESGLVEVEEQKVAGTRHVKSLSARLIELGQFKKKIEFAGQLDDGKGNRRGSALADLTRSMLAAKDVNEAALALGASLKTGLDPDQLFVAVAEDDGFRILMCTREDREGTVIGRDESAVMDTTGTGKIQLLGSPRTVGPGLDCNLLFPINANRAIVAMVGLDAPTMNDREDLEFVGVTVKIAEGILGRLGIVGRS